MKLNKKDTMDIRKLQRAIVDGLEDVKAQDIKVFDTTHLTELFDRVVIASGNSNRQTKALAASVRDTVKDAGGHIVAVEGWRPASGCWWTAATPWCTSCSRNCACTTTWKRSGATSRCA
jgi:ribosome silencing factor RsfS/YbeB/iojap